VAPQVDRAFEAALATEDPEVLKRIQSRTFEAMFETLFRVLKACIAPAKRLTAAEEVKEALRGAGAADDAATTPEMRLGLPLLMPALRVLARHAHLIGLEYFEDLTAALARLLRSPVLGQAQRVELLLAVSEILRQQMGSLRVDRRKFSMELYALLEDAAAEPLLPWHPVGEAVDTGDVDLHGGGEAGAGEAGDLGGVAAAGDAQVREAHDQQLRLVRVFEQMLLHERSADQPTMAALAKRAMGAARWGRPGLGMGLLGGCKGLLKRHGRLRMMLENEGDGPAASAVGGAGPSTGEARWMGGFHPAEPDPAESGAVRSLLWELSLLSAHYHPHVRAISAALVSMDVNSGAFPNHLAGAPTLNPLLTPSDLGKIHAAECRGEFRPGPPPPKPLKAGAVRRRRLAVPLGAEAERAFGAELDGEGLAAEAAPEGGEVAAEAEVGALWRAHFRAQRGYDEQARLSREDARLQRLLHGMREHLARAAPAPGRAAGGGAGGKRGGKGKGRA